LPAAHDLNNEFVSSRSKWQTGDRIRRPSFAAVVSGLFSALLFEELVVIFLDSGRIGRLVTSWLFGSDCFDRHDISSRDDKPRGGPHQNG